jgi:hypothetical protein
MKGNSKQRNYEMYFGKCWTAVSKGFAVAAVTVGTCSWFLGREFGDGITYFY